MPFFGCARKAASSVLASALHAALILGLAFAHLGYQAAAGVAEARAEEAAPADPMTSEDFEKLVGPVALYPDELLAIVLPASTFPLQIVQASRFLEQHKGDPDLKPEEDWDESVIGLLNYPEVIDLLNEDLDWTWELGAAVSDHEGDVMDAVQSFRQKADKAGNLETNDKMTVTKETPDLPEGETVPEGQEGEKVIVIESSSTEVIYVPQYQPTTVVVYQTAPYPYYYSAPYPYYYSPSAAFWTGVFVGAAIGYGMRWGYHGHYHRHGGIHVNRNVNINVNNKNVNRRKANLNSGGGDWKGNKGKGAGDRAKSGGRPGSKNTGSRPSTTQRDMGGTGRAGGQAGAGDANRAGSRDRAGTSSRSGAAAGGSKDRASSPSRDMTKPSTRSGTSGKSSYGSNGGRSSSVGNYGAGSSARTYSSRGHSSRSGSRGGGGGGHRGGGRR